MSIINRSLHEVTSMWANYHLNNFLKNSKGVEKQQRKILNKIIGQTYDAPAHAARQLSPMVTYEQFARSVHQSSYQDWSDWIDYKSKKLCGLSDNKLSRYQPTSGSTSQIKWIPYTNEFLKEINHALMPWIAGMYNKFPQIKEGTHYWSVSWVPTELRESTDDNVNDDLRMLPYWKRFVASRYMSVPDCVSMADSCDDTLFASIAWLLASRDLSFVSIWSPTFLLTLLEQIEQHKEELIKVLSNGKWTRKSLNNARVPCPQSIQAAYLLKIAVYIKDPEFLKTLWPSLVLISSWDTASSATWAKEVANLFPNAHVQGKGLWATEGAVTFPLFDRYPLAINSHFYEFIDLDSDKILPSWELKKGMSVSPLLTTASGFYRYHLKDYLVVDDFINECPCLNFVGRIDGTDMVGEKISTQIVANVINELNENYRIGAVALVAMPEIAFKKHGINSNSRYVLLCEDLRDSSINTPMISQYLESLLQKNFHYQLARDLGQLEESIILSIDNARKIYEYRCLSKGMSVGNIKHEPLYQWDTDLDPELEQLLINELDMVPPLLRA